MALTQPTLWALNSLGRYNANLALAQQWRGLAVKGGPRGIVIFVRSVQDSEWVAEYMEEHRVALNFDNYAFVVGGIDVSDEMEASEKVHERANSRVVSSPGGACYSIYSNGDLLDASSDVMEILHRIRQNNDAIEWSIDVTGVVGLLRPAIYQYAHLSGIPTFYIAKQKKNTGGGVYKSGLTGSKHFLRLPDKSHIDSIKDALNNEKLARFVATVYRFYDTNHNSSMGLEKNPYGDDRPYHFNRENFPTGHPLRMDDIPKRSARKKNMDRQLAKAVDTGLVYLSGKDIHLTPAGIVAGSLLNG